MDIDLGYIQLIPSPWDEKRAFLTLTGTTDRSINGVVDILAYRPWGLGGNLALITADSNIRTIDTRELTSKGVAAAIATAVPEVTPVVETELEDIQVAEREATAIPTPVPSNSSSNVSSSEQTLPRTTTPTWLIPFVVIVAVITIAIFVVAFWQSRQRS
jgi:hypothetical protein